MGFNRVLFQKRGMLPLRVRGKDAGLRVIRKPYKTSARPRGLAQLLMGRGLERFFAWRFIGTENRKPVLSGNQINSSMWSTPQTLLDAKREHVAEHQHIDL